MAHEEGGSNHQNDTIPHWFRCDLSAGSLLAVVGMCDIEKLQCTDIDEGRAWNLSAIGHRRPWDARIAYWISIQKEYRYNGRNYVFPPGANLRLTDVLSTGG
ncbi:TonB-dependent receptor [Anopheles sinensis]|uniref:TonB-dependent receptor n=1 Tax=Anopheles sinensis TaxID=74873 RepID=A0A084WDI1_ANOSI|nr:TonB-dependent receptor [Anopheles sinensis]